MSGRFLVRLVAALALVGLLAVVGVNLYNAGVSAGLSDAGNAAIASGAPAVYYPNAYIGHAWGPGFGFFGFFVWILAFFLFFGLIRAAFGWGRWGGRGPGRWGEHGEHGERGERGPRGYLDDWHRRAHDEGESGSRPTG